MTGTDLVGEAGSMALKQLLTTCTDPVEAITTFQLTNAVKCPSLTPALTLLDLHNVRRSEYHEIVMGDLCDRLVAKIRDTATGATTSASETASNHTTATSSTSKSQATACGKKLKELVQRSFPFVNIPQLRPIVLEALKQIPTLPREYLQQIKRDSNLYKDVAVEVKQQIWVDEDELFLEEIKPVIEEYLTQKHKYFVDLDTYYPTYFVESSKVRRRSTCVQQLAQMMGKVAVLYDRFLQYLRQLFVETKNDHLCSLRCELLMALHENDVQELINLDPCHKFAWCLDACMREKHLDPKHASELKNVLDSVQKKGKERVLGDLGMIVADPYALHFLNQLVAKVLNQCTNNETLPRDNSSLQLLLRLLNLGLNSWRMHSPDGEYKESKIDTIIYTKFLTCLMAVMCEDQCRTLRMTSSTPDDPAVPTSSSDGAATPVDKIIDRTGLITLTNRETSSNDKTTSGFITGVIEPFVKSDPLCCSIALYYVLDVAKKRDASALMNFLPVLSRGNDALAYRDTFAQLLIWHLVSAADLLSVRDDLFDAVFGRFFLKKTGSKFQTAKLALFCAGKLPKMKRDYLLECMRSSETSGDIDDDDELGQTEFRAAVNALDRKFHEVDAAEREPPEIAAAPASVAASVSRSISIDFPDVPTPMTPMTPYL